MEKIFKNIATVFGVGNIPWAPGTWGSLAGLLLCIIFHANTGVYLGIFLLLFAAGLVSSSLLVKETGLEDPSYVVIDEAACIFVVFMFIPMTVPVMLIGFALYRGLDIIKPFPIRLLEKLPGGWGIMLDDLASAIIANLIIRVLLAASIL